MRVLNTLRRRSFRGRKKAIAIARVCSGSAAHLRSLGIAGNEVVLSTVSTSCSGWAIERKSPGVWYGRDRLMDRMNLTLVRRIFDLM